MALEPKGVPPADAGPNPELVDFTHRLRIGAALSIPLLVIAMGPDLGLPLHRWLSPQAAGWIELVARDARGRRGAAGRSSSAAGRRSSTAAPTCGR